MKQGLKTFSCECAITSNRRMCMLKCVVTQWLSDQAPHKSLSCYSQLKTIFHIFIGHSGLVSHLYLSVSDGDTIVLCEILMSEVIFKLYSRHSRDCQTLVNLKIESNIRFVCLPFIIEITISAAMKPSIFLSFCFLLFLREGLKVRYYYIPYTHSATKES